jgi:hypothetical protein
MLTAVLLHVIEAPHPIHTPLNRALWQQAIDNMQNLGFTIANVDEISAA